jgi:isoleucyl-tRNA synthetase
MDYRKTLNLPSNDFPMRANLPIREPEIQAYWDRIEIYKKAMQKPAPRGKFVLHDGPPYSNGEVHFGTALNKILKDFVVKHRIMDGYYSPYIPGWDNHGMPIENEVLKTFDEEGITPTRSELIARCREFAEKYVDVMRRQFMRLGAIGDWYNPYLTMARYYEADLVRVFGELAKRGYIYRGLRPTPWCAVHETALAQAEIEYMETESWAIYVRFPLLRDPKGIFGDADPLRCYALIWTTTPWTIPANLAVAVHPDFNYVIVKARDATYLVLRDLLASTMEKLGTAGYEVVGELKGKDAEGTVFRHPIFDRESPLLIADFVVAGEGTGIVHIAPGHGAEDFDLGRQNGLPILCPVDDRGRFTEEAGPYAGLHVQEGDLKVIEDMRANGNLLDAGKVLHEYPRCWRCKSELLFRATEQWFMNVDHEGHRKKCMDIIKKVAWYPKESIKRIEAMVSGRPDWCLSRQRVWGVGVPAFHCNKCGNAFVNQEAIEIIAKRIEEGGAAAWHEGDVRQFLPPGAACPRCGSTDLRKETDILDVWFDSGSTCRVVFENYDELDYPCDLYLEGPDQHRGWFNTSLMVGVGTKGAAPYRAVVTHGWTLDGEGRAMHKSTGNAVPPEEIIGKYGADCLRLYVSSTDYFNDVRYSDEIMSHIVDAYRRIRNTLRFLINNLYDFEPSKAVPYKEMREIDRWVLSKLQGVIEACREGFEIYEYHRAYHTVHSFCARELSSFYLDVCKDTLYAEPAGSRARRSVQTAFAEILSVLARVLAPILSHTCEEVREVAGGKTREMADVESILLASFPEPRGELRDTSLEERWAYLMRLRDLVYQRVEEARNKKVVAQPLEAKITIRLPESEYDHIAGIEPLLAEALITSEAHLTVAENSEIEVVVEKAPGAKCERCWQYRTSVGAQKAHPTLCQRCADVVG